MASPRLLEIDETNIGDHFFLAANDQCYYFYEFTSGTGYSNGQGNQLITNLKKSPLRSGQGDYKYKGRAIRDCSAWLAAAMNDGWLSTGTLVPVPPSKARDHAEYDDRMLLVLDGIEKSFAVDVRELVVQTETIRAAHESADNRPSIGELERFLV